MGSGGGEAITPPAVALEQQQQQQQHQAPPPQQPAPPPPQEQQQQQLQLQPPPQGQEDTVELPLPDAMVLASAEVRSRYPHDGNVQTRACCLPCRFGGAADPLCWRWTRLT